MIELLMERGNAYVIIDKDIVVPELRGYPVGSQVDQGTYSGFELLDILEKEFLVKDVPVTITTTVLPSGSGTVEGGGVYNIGDTVSLTVIANKKYKFKRWSNGSNNPIMEFTATQDETITAIFERVYNYATITVNASDDEGVASIQGAGQHEIYDVVDVGVALKPHWNFIGWDDGETANPRTLEVLKDETFTALLQEDPKVTITASTDGYGSIIGDGEYYVGDTVTLTAIPGTDWAFDHWWDGEHEYYDATITFTATEDADYIAFLRDETPWETIQVHALPPESSDYTSGDGDYRAGADVEIYVHPKEGWEFVQWTDGNTENPRTVHCESPGALVDYWAQLERVKRTLTTASSPETGGTTTGDGKYNAGTEVEISATPKSADWGFKQWDDGSTENPRTIIMPDEDITYTATFQYLPIYIDVKVTPAGSGTTTGSGRKRRGDTITIEAIPNGGYEFVKWNDGNTDNPRQLYIDGSHNTYTATLQPRTDLYAIHVVSDPPEGVNWLGGEGRYHYGATAEIDCDPNSKYRFDHWELTNPDGSVETFTDRTIQVTCTEPLLPEPAEYTYKAVMKLITDYTVTVQSYPPDYQTGGDGVYQVGEVAHCWVAIDDDHYVDRWVYTGASSGEIVTHALAIDLTWEEQVPGKYYINPIIKEKQPITVMVKGEPNTAVADIDPGGPYRTGDLATFKVTPNDGYEFYYWKEDGNTDNPRDVVVYESATYTAVLRQIVTATVLVEDPDGIGGILTMVDKQLPERNATYEVEDGKTYSQRIYMTDEPGLCGCKVDYSCTSVPVYKASWYWWYPVTNQWVCQGSEELGANTPSVPGYDNFTASVQLPKLKLVLKKM